MKIDRRRETRLPGSLARFYIETPESLVECKVTNLSRLGLGIELPLAFSSKKDDIIVIGNILKGHLYLATKKILLEAQIRVYKENFIGLEYTNYDDSFISILTTLLTPAYIGTSVHKINKKYLATDVEDAWQGDDFECIVFKKGQHKKSQIIQFFAVGGIVEFSVDDFRFVPPSLARGTGLTTGYDFILEFSKLYDDKETTLKTFLLWIKQIIEYWPECPLFIKEIVNKKHKELI